MGAAACLDAAALVVCVWSYACLLYTGANFLNQVLT